MDVKEAIEKRRSIRKYKDKEVEDEKINELLEAARLSPSAHNSQTYKFLIIKDEERKKEISEAFVQNFVCKAPVLIICLSNQEGYGIDEDYMENASIVDTSIAGTMMVLRAEEMNLGTCFIAWFDKKKLKEKLNLENKYYIPFVLTLGYPDENPEVRPRKDLNEIIHR